jgi:hypothetical protein
VSDIDQKLSHEQEEHLRMLQAGKRRKQATEKLGVNSYRALRIALHDGKDALESR